MMNYSEFGATVGGVSFLGSCWLNSPSNRRFLRSFGWLEGFPSGRQSIWRQRDKTVRGEDKRRATNLKVVVLGAADMSQNQKHNQSVFLSGSPHAKSAWREKTNKSSCWIDTLTSVCFKHRLISWMHRNGFKHEVRVRRPAELRVPVHGVDVEEHGATGVCHIGTVDPSAAAPRQALGETKIWLPQGGGQQNNLLRSQMNSHRCVTPTHMIQESTVPNMARPLRTVWRTSATLSSSQRSFTALK